MSGIPLLDEKCIGAFVSSAIGDALGWPNEFRSSNTNKQLTTSSSFIQWQRRSGGRYWNHTEIILAGEYSDDTQMNLAVARSLLSGKPWLEHFVSSELPFWTKYERGGGKAVLRAANAWQNKVEPWKSKDERSYFEAGGNGAAMRVLPHVISNRKATDFEPIAKDVIDNSIQTHGHPRAIAGALCYAYALYYLINKQNTLEFGELITSVCNNVSEWGAFPSVLSGEWLTIANRTFEYEDLWNKTVKETIDLLQLAAASISKGVLDTEIETLASLGCMDKRINGAGDVGAVAAIYLASKYANNPVLGIKSAANALGSDTDTIASMTGGLLGAICGTQWIPTEWKLVQDYDCIVRTASFLLSENGSETAKEFVLSKTQQSELWEKTPIGLCKKTGEYQLASGKTGVISVSKYETSLGQTLYFKSFSRNSTSPVTHVQTSFIEEKKYTLIINPQQIPQLMNDTDICNMDFKSLLSIIEMLNQGITSVDMISQQSNISKSVVQRIMNLTVPIC